MNNIANHNARMALKQVRMEIAADYGMNYEYAFDIIENAHNDGALASYFRNLENKKNTHQVKYHQ